MFQSSKAHTIAPFLEFLLTDGMSYHTHQILLYWITFEINTSPPYLSIYHQMSLFWHFHIISAITADTARTSRKRDDKYSCYFLLLLSLPVKLYIRTKYF